MPANAADGTPLGDPRRPAGRILALTFLVLVAGSGCRDSFEPYRSSDLHFSIFGYLDATADTQWIRVTPVRQTVFTTPEKLHATVTLEDLQTGVTTELHDSVFTYQASADVEGAAGSWVHNYWTDVPIRYSASYRLSVVGADGETATATASVPDEMREVVVESRLVTAAQAGRPSVERYFVRVKVKHVPLVQVIHYVADRTPASLIGTYTDCPFAPEVSRVYPARQNAPLSVGADLTEIELTKSVNPILLQTGTTPATCVIHKRDVLIASPGFDWPTGVQFSPSAPTLGAVPSSIEGGVGFVGGLVIRTVPFENCALRPAVSGNSCVLRYNDQSATIQGVVTDSRCGWPVEGAAVELTTPGAPPTMVRTDTTDQAGRFRFGALVGGTTYAVLVSQPLRWPPNDPFAVQRAYVDLQSSVTAQIGTTRTQDLVLQRQVACALN